MNRILQFIHDNQIVVAALILFLAVLTYCLFNRYDAIRYSENSFVTIDHLVGKCLLPDGTPVKGNKH